MWTDDVAFGPARWAIVHVRYGNGRIDDLSIKNQDDIDSKYLINDFQTKITIS